MVKNETEKGTFAAQLPMSSKAAQDPFQFRFDPYPMASWVLVPKTQDLVCGALLAAGPGGSD